MLTSSMYHLLWLDSREGSGHLREEGRVKKEGGLLMEGMMYEGRKGQLHGHLEGDVRLEV